MSEPAKTPFLTDPGVRNYSGICFCALLAVLMGLVQREQGWSALFPFGLGLLTLVVRWRIGPLVFLLALGLMLFGPTLLTLGRIPPRTVPQLADLVMALGVLAYIGGHYRLQGLVTNIFPSESKTPTPPRKGLRGPSPMRDQPRSASLATKGELILLLASLPVWVGLALVLYPRLLPKPGSLPSLENVDGFSGSSYGDLFLGSMVEFAEAAWRCRILVILTGIVVLSMWGVIRYLVWISWNSNQAKMFLQDVAWKETCGEQRQINIWRMWRKQRKP